MEQYNVTGMSCAACSARVEKAVSKVDGVTSCSVSLLTNSMGVEGTAADQAIIDAVQAARFITESKSRSLIKKLESLVSVHDARQLQRQVLIAGRVKTMNESIYYNIDKLHSAIGEGKQIRFQYFQWTVEKKEALRRDGGWYCVSPWHMRWDDENYYLIAYDAEADRV